jgi:multiple sugar transport system substrate-binding protein
MANQDTSRPEAPSTTGPRSVTRRDVLKGMAVVAGAAAVPTILAACGAGATAVPTAAAASVAAPSTGAASAAPASAAGVTGTVTVGSNHSDPSEVKGMAAINAAFIAANPGITVTVNAVDHDTFQNQISSYLQGTPQDDFTWFSGYRMRFFASKGLTTAIDDVWAKVSSNYTGAFATAVTGDDSHVYGIPVDYYPWAVFYRKSVFSDKGYTIPATWADFKTLCTKMQSDGLIPITFGDKDGWPAMGTFDILDLRLNGYDFHTQLLTGKQKWTDPKVTTVFQKWAEIMPFHDKTFAGLTWEKACDTLIQKKSGMFMFGLFLTGEFSSTGTPADLADLDFFPFPAMGTQYDAEDALDAPIDVWMVSAKSPTLQADLDAAKAYMEFWSKGSTQLLMFQNQPGFIPTANDADPSSYDPLTKKAVQIVSQAKKITQFLDRDSRPDFAGANGMQGFLQKFLANYTQDTTALQAQIQAFWDALPPATV